jgi:hypothetical protein
MIKIEKNKLDEICNNYCEKIHLALENRVNSISVLINVLKIPKRISNLSNKDLHYKTAISIINLTSKSIKNESKLHKVILHLQSNGTIISFELEKIFKNLSSIITDIKNENLLASNPDKLVSINEIMKKKKYNERLVSYLFNYNNYRYIIDNYLAKPLGIIVCPYCNRNYISYIPQNGDETSEEKVIGPTYDHFFYKEKYTFLTLSFYNLVPSCYVCNSNLKRSIDFDYKTHINPFEEGFDDSAYFDFELTPEKNTKKINFTPIIKEKNSIAIDKKIRIFGNNSKDDSGNVRVFKLKEIYATHNDTVEDVYMNFDRNNQYFVDSILVELNKLGSSEAEFYRFHFKNYFNEEDFNKRPLAKLTRDIYMKMKDINYIK